MPTHRAPTHPLGVAHAVKAVAVLGGWIGQLGSGATNKRPAHGGAVPVSTVVRWARCVVASGALGGSLLLAGCGSTPPAPARAPQADPLSDIAIHALGLVGTPYRYGGNTPESGFDCSGLIGYVYKSRTGVAPPRTVAQLASFGQAVNAHERRTGDLVIFGSGRPTHAGIYVGGGRFVHAPSTGGTVRLDRLDNRHWASQPTAFRRP